jgi:AcrR family transcriptional regulator
MLTAAAGILRERGAAGVTIDAVLTRSGAPRGSVYHHFPDGRTQLLREALQYAGDEITASIDKAADESAGELLGEFVDLWERSLMDSDFAAGCPVLAAAVGSGVDEQQLTSLAGVIFDRWREATTQAFVRDGFDPAGAASLAAVTISALEGAVVLCRASRSLKPLHDVANQVEFLIKAREFVSQFGNSAITA